MCTNLVGEKWEKENWTLIPASSFLLILLEQTQAGQEDVSVFRTDLLHSEAIKSLALLHGEREVISPSHASSWRALGSSEEEQVPSRSWSHLSHHASSSQVSLPTGDFFCKGTNPLTVPLPLSSVSFHTLRVRQPKCGPCEGHVQVPAISKPESLTLRGTRQ